MFTPCNACPVEFTDSSGTPLGIQQRGPISLGPAPWNENNTKKHLFQCMPVVPLLQNSCNLRYAIPLGFYNSRIRISQKAPLIEY